VNPTKLFYRYWWQMRAKYF